MVERPVLFFFNLDFAACIEASVVASPGLVLPRWITRYREAYWNVGGMMMTSASCPAADRGPVVKAVYGDLR